LQAVVFIGMMVIALCLAHLYVWRRAVRAPALPRRAGIAGAILLAAGALLTVAAFVVPRLVGPESGGPVAFIGFTWLGFLFYLVLLFGLADFGRLLAALVRRLRNRWRAAHGVPAGNSPVDPGRRAFLARVTAVGAVLGAGGVSLAGLRGSDAEIINPVVPVRLPGFPPALSGFRVALLSDLHVGSVLGRRFVERVVERTSALRPDLVAIVGDLVDGTPSILGPALEPLSRLWAPHGVFFVTGNHEYYSGVDAWLVHLPRLGIRVLQNERVEVGDRSPGGARFDLAGVHDWHAARFAEGPDLQKALRGRFPERPLVLLAHQPAQVEEASQAGVSLQLSGHTHGGQIWPFGAMVGLQQPYISGLHRHGPVTQIYVTRGTGFWGPPIRILAPAEITTIVLTA
jgi:predicted MPP superfamily phosphohydrolase